MKTRKRIKDHAIITDGGNNFKETGHGFNQSESNSAISFASNALIQPKEYLQNQSYIEATRDPFQSTSIGHNSQVLGLGLAGENERNSGAQTNYPQYWTDERNDFFF